MTTALQANSTQGPGAPSDFGDARAEFHALLSGCGVYDLGGRAKIRLTGNDRIRWLNGMVTNNIRDLAPNHGVYCFLLNAQGHIQADLYAYNLDDSLMVDLDAGLREKVLAHFDKFIIMDDVQVADLSGTLTAIGIGGPEAKSVLDAAGIHVADLAPASSSRRRPAIARAVACNATCCAAAIRADRHTKSGWRPT